MKPVENNTPVDTCAKISKTTVTGRECGLLIPVSCSMIF